MARRTFFGIQVLRGVAAAMVVLLHAGSGLTGPGGFHALPSLTIGNAGVDLFFVISGFVMTWTTRESWQRPGAWADFLGKRTSRVLPLYWLLTTAKIIVMIAAPSLFRASQPTGADIVASYVLIPAWDAHREVRLVVASAWTLCFEMAFYYVVTACLALNRRPTFLATPFLVALGLLGTIRPENWDGLGLLIDPLLLEFVAGMWIAELTGRNDTPRRALPMRGLILIAVALWLASSQLSEDTAYSFRVLVWGVPAAFIVLAVVTLETSINFSKLRLLLLLGDASYSTYLGHAFILQPLVAWARRIPLSPTSEVAVLLAMVLIALVFGILMWQLLERKLITNMLALLRPHWSRVWL